MQQHSTHAALGAWSLGQPLPAACGDGHRSVRLVGSTTGDAAPSATGIISAHEDIAGAASEFARSVHSWLADPRMQATHSEQTLADAATTIEIAVAHFRELDLMAGTVARDAAASGEINPQQLQQIGAMASTIEAFSTRLYSVLDPDSTDAPVAARRLRAAVDASTHGGGLAALVAAL